MFVKPPTWENRDEAHTWVTMPRSAVDEQLAAGQESYCDDISMAESEKSVAVSRRVAFASKYRRLEI